MGAEQPDADEQPDARIWTAVLAAERRRREQAMPARHCRWGTVLVLSGTVLGLLAAMALGGGL